VVVILHRPQNIQHRNKRENSPSVSRDVRYYRIRGIRREKIAKRYSETERDVEENRKEDIAEQEE